MLSRVLKVIAKEGMLKGGTIAVDATTLEAKRRCARSCGETRVSAASDYCGSVASGSNAALPIYTRQPVCSERIYDDTRYSQVPAD